MARAVALLRAVLLRIRPKRLKGKTRGRLEWSLPPASSRPLPALMPTVAVASPIHQRVMPMKCWTLGGLDFKSSGVAGEAPAYNSSKHTFYLELVHVTGSRTISLQGRLRGTAGGDVGHIPFSGRALRYVFALDQLLPDSLLVPEGKNGGDWPSLLVDIVNQSPDSSMDPVCKVRPLFGYGRIDFNFVLRQSGAFWLRLSLEQPKSGDGPSAARMSAIAKELQTIQATSYFTYDTRSAKKLRCFATMTPDASGLDPGATGPHVGPTPNATSHQLIERKTVVRTPSASSSHLSTTIASADAASNIIVLSPPTPPPKRTVVILDRSSLPDSAPLPILPPPPPTLPPPHQPLQRIAPPPTPLPLPILTQPSIVPQQVIPTQAALAIHAAIQQAQQQQQQAATNNRHANGMDLTDDVAAVDHFFSNSPAVFSAPPSSPFPPLPVGSISPLSGQSRPLLLPSLTPSTPNATAPVALTTNNGNDEHTRPEGMPLPSTGGIATGGTKRMRTGTPIVATPNPNEVTSPSGAYTMVKAEREWKSPALNGMMSPPNNERKLASLDPSHQQFIEMLQGLYLNSAEGREAIAAKSPNGMVTTTPNETAVRAPVPRLISHDGGSTLKLYSNDGDWSSDTSVFFHFGHQYGSTLADDKINRYQKRERMVFIPPIPEQVWKDAVAYARSLATSFAKITPTVSADVIVARDEKTTDPVVGYYTYPAEMAIDGPSGPSMKPDPFDDDKDGNDRDKRGPGGGGGSGGGGNGRNNGNATGSRAGMVIRVAQEFFIPYNRMHMLLMASLDAQNIGALDLSDADGPLTSALINGFELMLQWFVDYSLSLLGPVPSARQQFLACYFPNGRGENSATRGTVAAGVTASFSTEPGAESPVPSERQLTDADIWLFIRHALELRGSRFAINTYDAAGFTIAHYLAVLDQHSLLHGLLYQHMDTAGASTSTSTPTLTLLPPEGVSSTALVTTSALSTVAATNGSGASTVIDPRSLLVEDIAGFDLTPLHFLSATTIIDRLGLTLPSTGVHPSRKPAPSLPSPGHMATPFDDAIEDAAAEPLSLAGGYGTTKQSEDIHRLHMDPFSTNDRSLASYGAPTLSPTVSGDTTHARILNPLEYSKPVPLASSSSSHLTSPTSSTFVAASPEAIAAAQLAEQHNQSLLAYNVSISHRDFDTLPDVAPPSSGKGGKTLEPDVVKLQGMTIVPGPQYSVFEVGVGPERGPPSSEGRAKRRTICCTMVTNQPLHNHII
jgi:hypothetical protein